MAQIQLYVTKTQRGYKHLLSINPTDEVMRCINDLTPTLQPLHYDAAAAPWLYVSTNIERGLLLSIIRPIAGDRHDHYAVTVFFPEGMHNTVDSFNRIIDGARNLIAAGGDPRHEDVADMRTLLSADYQLDKSQPRHFISTGHNYGYARYGSQGAPSISDYARQSFYQPGYSSYAGIVLFNPQEGVSAASHVSDLTKYPLEEVVRVNPPTKRPRGFMPTLGRRPFDTPMLAGKGQTLTIEWRRSGFEAVHQEFTVTGDGAVPEAPEVGTARRMITPSSFFITEQGSHRTIGNYYILVNGVEIDGPKVFTYDELLNARVEISSPGYFAYKGTIDLATTTQALVQMKVLHKTYRFDLPLELDEAMEPIRIYLKTKDEVKRSPIKGYRVVDDEIIEGTGVANRLEYEGTHAKPYYRLYPLVAGVALLIGLFLGWLAFSGDNNSPRAVPEAPAAIAAPADEAQTQPAPVAAEAPAEAPVADTPEVAATSADALAQAVEYLDRNREWSRTAMEAMPSLRGLFDDINNYNRERLLTYWRPLLGASKNFEAVARAVEGSTFKRDPRTGDHTPTFVPEGTDAINWRSYTFWVDP